jgi:transcriptional regulator with XRE-family HTH domain
MSTVGAEEIGTTESETTRNLGAEIRSLRRDRGLTLKEVAARTGLSVSMLSMLERGMAGASIGSLVAVSSALSVPVARLFDTKPEPDSQVHRLADQPQVEASPGVLRRTVHSLPTDGVEMVVLDLEPGTDTGQDLIRHSSQEFMLMVSGAVRVELEQGSHTLDKGDGMQIAAGALHRFVNASTEPAEVVLMTYRAP